MVIDAILGKILYYHYHLLLEPLIIHLLGHLQNLDS